MNEVQVYTYPIEGLVGFMVMFYRFTFYRSLVKKLSMNIF